MKLIQKSAMLIVLCSVIVLSSCHRSGCPGQITDTQKIEQPVVSETIIDEDC